MVKVAVLPPGVTEGGEKVQELNEGSPEHENETALLNAPNSGLMDNA
jgi:hypothetical protein